MQTLPIGAVEVALVYQSVVVQDQERPRTGSAKETVEVAGRRVIGRLESIDLGAFELIPDHLELEAGKTYLFQVENVHEIPHNVFIGDRGSKTLAFSATIAGDATTSFPWTAEAGEFQMWCDVPGHADLGMIGTVSVS